MNHTQPISTINDAKAYIENLVKHDLLFHFDDDVSELGCFTDEEVPQVEARMNEIYLDSFDWVEDECPIGYALKVSGLGGSNENQGNL